MLDDVGPMAIFAEFFRLGPDVLSSAVKATVLSELGPGVCPGAGSVVIFSDYAAGAGISDEVLAVVACSVVAALAQQRLSQISYQK